MANQHRYGSRNIRGVSDELWAGYAAAAGEKQRSPELAAFMQFRVDHPRLWLRLTERAEAEGVQPFVLLAVLLELALREDGDDEGPRTP